VNVKQDGNDGKEMEANSDYISRMPVLTLLSKD
jgi:hypothetical protein